MPKIVDPEQRRTEIIHGLWAVIYERGIHAVTYQAVAQAAGVSVGRIQHYFDSKQDLVHAGCRAMVEGAAEAHEQRTDALEPLAALTELLIQPIPRSDAFRLGSAVWYAYLAQTVADPQIAEIIGGASRETFEYAASLLRSAGVNVASTNRGYVLVEGGVPAACRRTFKVRHGEDRMADELRLVVDLGGTVEDVVVNHRTYGRVRAPLGIGSRRDIDRFVRDLATSKSAPISRITSGYHFHHVTAPSEEILDEIEDALGSGGYLVERMPYEMGEDL